MKIKMFSKLITPKLSFFLELKKPLHHEMEKEINEWLTQMPNIKIHHLKQTMSGGSWRPSQLIVSIFYE
jgi:hypothetical protein